MSTTLQNSIWPNAGGTLGENKVAIPDGVTIKWPDGDALVGTFVYQNGKLVGLVDTKALIENDSKTTVLPYDFVDITVDKRLETLMTFNAGERCKRLNVNYKVMLPAGYKRLEYLESTGTQYIDTDMKLSGEDEVECEFERTAYDTGSQAIFGVYAPEPKYALLCNLIGDSYLRLLAQSGSIFSKKIQNGEQIKFSKKNTNVYINDELVGTFTEQNETSVSCRIFSAVPAYYANARVYSFSIVRTGEMQRYFIPCLNDTGAPCMYDIISQELFYNEGTGQFLYPGAESQVVTSDLDEIFYAKKTAHGIQKLYHVPENFSGSKDEYAIENGFKQLVEPPMPTEGYWVPEWTETDTQLICNWVEDSVLP